MGKQATVFRLTASDQAELRRWMRSGSAQHRSLLRAQIILAAPAGERGSDIACLGETFTGVGRAVRALPASEQGALAQTANLHLRPAPAQPTRK